MSPKSSSSDSKSSKSLNFAKLVKNDEEFDEIYKKVVLFLIKQDNPVNAATILNGIKKEVKGDIVKKSVNSCLFTLKGVKYNLTIMDKIEGVAAPLWSISAKGLAKRYKDGKITKIGSSDPREKCMTPSPKKISVPNPEKMNNCILELEERIVEYLTKNDSDYGTKNKISSITRKILGEKGNEVFVKAVLSSMVKEGRVQKYTVSDDSYPRFRIVKKADKTKIVEMSKVIESTDVKKRKGKVEDSDKSSKSKSPLDDTSSDESTNSDNSDSEDEKPQKSKSSEKSKSKSDTESDSDSDNKNKKFVKKIHKELDKFSKTDSFEDSQIQNPEVFKRK